MKDPAFNLLKNKNLKIKLSQKTIGIIFIFIFSFLLNFLWESIHSVYLYEFMNHRASDYLQLMIHVALIDASLICLIYLLISFFSKDIIWVKEIEKIHIILTIIFASIISAMIEYDAVYLSSKWRYNELMPTIYGLGVSPLIQLWITALITFYFAGKIIKN